MGSRGGAEARRAVGVTFDFPDTPAALNRSLFRFSADTTLLRQNKPTGFVRPALRDIMVLGLESDGTLVATSAGIPILMYNTVLTANSSFVFGTPNFSASMYPWYMGEGDIRKLLIRSPYANTLNAILVRKPGTPGKEPQMVLTTSPVE